MQIFGNWLYVTLSATSWFFLGVPDIYNSKSTYPCMHICVVMHAHTQRAEALLIDVN